MCTSVVVCAFSCQGSLPSALRDAANLTLFWINRGVGDSGCHIFVETEQDVVLLRRNKLLAVHPGISYHVTSAATFCADVVRVFQGVSTKQAFFSISSHGFGAGRSPQQDESDGQNECFAIGAGRVVDDQIREHIWKPLLAACTCQILALVDTCHAGTMLDLPYRTLSNTALPEGRDYWPADSKLRVICFSGCTDAQLSMDDISTVGGFGGGLCSAFLDFPEGDVNNLPDLNAYIKSRLALLGQGLVVSSSHAKCLQPSLAF